MMVVGPLHDVFPVVLQLSHPRRRPTGRADAEGERADAPRQLLSRRLRPFGSRTLMKRAMMTEFDEDEMRRRVHLVTDAELERSTLPPAWWGTVPAKIQRARVEEHCTKDELVMRSEGRVTLEQIGAVERGDLGEVPLPVLDLIALLLGFRLDVELVPVEYEVTVEDDDPAA